METTQSPIEALEKEVLVLRDVLNQVEAKLQEAEILKNAYKEMYDNILFKYGEVKQESGKLKEINNNLNSASIAPRPNPNDRWRGDFMQLQQE